MSEPYDQDRDPLLRFTARVRTLERGEMELECNPTNTALYLHHPDRSDQYDHFFYKLKAEELPEEEQTRNLGAFLTAHVMGDDVFDDLAQQVTDAFEWTVLYRPDPTDSDREAIDSQMADILAKELEDLDPNDFMD